MLTYWLALALMSAILGGLTVGCTKRPASTSGWTVPAPTTTPGTAGTGDRAPIVSSVPSTATRAGGPGAADTLSGPTRLGEGAEGQHIGTRPAIRDFAPVSDLADVHFALDRYDVGPAQAKVLDGNARWLRSNGGLVLIEGHCDERGTSEYNLSLGERRAASAKTYLVSQGVASSRITIVSYGKERPQCTDRSEACWWRNRRAHFLVKRQ